MNHTLNFNTINKNRDNLIGGFKILRKRGYIARANYYCCSSCAGYAIGQRVSDMAAEKAAKVKGCVFWNQQDERGIEDDGTLYLAFGNIGSSTHGDIGLPTVEVGREVVSLLEQRGLFVKWDGTASSRILVDLTRQAPTTSMEKINKVLVPMLEETVGKIKAYAADEERPGISWLGTWKVESLISTAQELIAEIKRGKEIAKPVPVIPMLGPCATCGESMLPIKNGRARCPKCGYECKHRLPETWCECKEQKTHPNEEYVVWKGGGHGWACVYCGSFTQTG